MQLEFNTFTKCMNPSGWEADFVLDKPVQAGDVHVKKQNGRVRLPDVPTPPTILYL